MDSNRNSVRRVVKDRLSRLPDNLIHKIMSCFDMKYAVQTCLLSSRWEFLWTTMPCLNFSSELFGTLPLFAKFVKHVLSHRNHHVQVSSVKLDFRGAFSQVFVRNIAKYAFSHNVQELTVVNLTLNNHFYPPFLLSSRSLKQFTLTCNRNQLWDTSKTPLDFPALTTLNLSDITLCGDVFSKCVNLKNLTLKDFRVEGPENVFDIITPRLSDLILTNGNCSKTINVVAPELENLTIIKCSIKYVNAPPGLSSFCYRHMSRSWYYGYCGLLQFTNDGFNSLNKVSISLSVYEPNKAYKEEYARNTISMLQKLQSARYLTLNVDTVECLSSFPDLLSQNPSPFSNLVCLTIDSSMRKYEYKVTMSSQAINYLLKNSPRNTVLMKLPGSK